MATWKKVVVSGSSPEFANATLSGDLTVTGGDIVLGTTSIFSGGDTTSLNNIDALDATTEATIESAIDTLSNLTAASSLVTVGTIGTGAWQGTAINQTYLVGQSGTNTGDESDSSTTTKGIVELATTAETTTGTDTARAVTPDGLKDGYQGSTNVTTLGTIGTGTWNASVIASAKLDTDTAHLTTDQTFTGLKTFSGAITGSNYSASLASTASFGTYLGDGSNLTGISSDLFSEVSGDILIAEGGAATIQANSVALTTDTTGNYVGTITGGTGITSTAGTTGEGTTHSLSVDASQTQITSVGTIGAGTWQGTAINQTYLTGQSGTNTGDEVAASLTAAGVIEIATTAEVNTGTDDTRAVSPAGLTAWTGDTGLITVGTIGTGTWEGTTIAVAQGGTGATSLNNLITMGTHTAGNYVATITGGTGITSTGATSGETIAHSLSVDASQTQITSVGALDAGSITSNFGSINNGSSAITTTGTVSAGTLSVSGNATVDGNLDVNGTVTTIQSANLLVKDRFILMNSGSAAGDGGIIVQTESTASGSAFVYDDTGTRWGFQQGTKLAQDASTSTPDAYASAVVTSDDANYRKNGNIRVDSGEIYIYTE